MVMPLVTTYLVPALFSDLTLTQSVAIMEYIHDMRPDSRLLPASVEDRAKVRMVTEIVASGIQPHQVTRDDHETSIHISTSPYRAWLRLL